MKYHMDHKHSDIEWKAKEKSAEPSDAGPPGKTNATQYNAIRKRGSYALIYSMCPKRRRPELFQSTIPNWVEAKTMLKFTSEKAQRYHQHIFEMLVMDLLPFHTVSKPGFLRLQAVQVPNFDVASDTFYRNMLGPSYDR